MKNKDVVPPVQRFALVFPPGKYKSKEEEEAHKKALQEHCIREGVCTQQEFDNMKVLAAQMWPGFLKNVIVPALVDAYLKEREATRDIKAPPKKSTKKKRE